MATTKPTFLYESKEVFFREGLEITGEGEEQMCCICLEPTCCSMPKAREEDLELSIKIIACGHEFGVRCVTDHFTTSDYGTCPLCRVKLFPTQKDEWDIIIAAANEQIAQEEEDGTSEETEEERAARSRRSFFFG